LADLKGGSDVINGRDTELFKSCFAAWVESLRDEAPDIVSHGDDYQPGLKANQPAFLEDVAGFFANAPADMLEPAFKTTGSSLTTIWRGCEPETVQPTWPSHDTWP
jgi:hypothetical protein